MALTHPYVHDGPVADGLTVVIADDHPPIAQTLRHMLRDAEDLQIVGEAAGVAELTSLVERLRPDVVVVDLMPGGRAIETIGRLHAEHPGLTIVVVSGREERAAIDAALAAGASAYVLRGAPLVDLASVLRHAASGAVFLAPAPAPAAAFAPAPVPASTARPGLTGRELAILEAITSGMTTSAISRELWISEHTIKFHLTNIYRKLRVSNRASAIRYALEHRLV